MVDSSRFGEALRNLAVFAGSIFYLFLSLRILAKKSTFLMLTKTLLLLLEG